jgi:hypothetical protein
LYSTGASRPVPERAHNLTNNASTTGAVDPALALGAVSADAVKTAAPQAPTPVVELSNYDWTIKKPVVEKTEVPPAKPLYLKLIEHLQSMWRASGNAVEVVDELNRAANPAKLVQAPLVYPDPKLKKVSKN